MHEAGLATTLIQDPLLLDASWPLWLSVKCAHAIHEP
jgi:hypothetical protein